MSRRRRENDITAFSQRLEGGYKLAYSNVLFDTEGDFSASERFGSFRPLERDYSELSPSVQGGCLQADEYGVVSSAKSKFFFAPEGLQLNEQIAESTSFLSTQLLKQHTPPSTQKTEWSDLPFRNKGIGNDFSAIAKGTINAPESEQGGGEANTHHYEVALGIGLIGIAILAFGAYHYASSPQPNGEREHSATQPSSQLSHKGEYSFGSQKFNIYDAGADGNCLPRSIMAAKSLKSHHKNLALAQQKADEQHFDLRQAIVKVAGYEEREGRKSAEEKLKEGKYMDDVDMAFYCHGTGDIITLYYCPKRCALHYSSEGECKGTQNNFDECKGEGKASIMPPGLTAEHEHEQSSGKCKVTYTSSHPEGSIVEPFGEVRHDHIHILYTCVGCEGWANNHFQVLDPIEEEA